MERLWHKAQKTEAAETAVPINSIVERTLIVGAEIKGTRNTIITGWFKDVSKRKFR